MSANNQTYKSFSMEYGTFIGLAWGALFLCYAEGIRTNNALLILLCLMLCGISVVLPFFFAFRLNRKLFTMNEKLSYLQGLIFSFSMFMYACLMSGLITFAYFQFFDDGSLHEQMYSLLTQPETATIYQQMGMTEQYEQITSIFNEFATFSPLDKTLLLFNNNFVFSIIFSFITAAVASYNLSSLIRRQ